MLGVACIPPTDPEKRGQMSIEELDILLLLFIGIIAIVDFMVPSWTWKDIAPVIGITTVIRAYLKWTLLSKKQRVS